MNATIENNSSLTAQRQVAVHVFYAGIYPVHFHRNLCGDVFELVPLENATVFPSEEAAVKAAVKAGIQQYSIQSTAAAEVRA